MVILDTDHMTFFLNPRSPEYGRLNGRLQLEPADQVATTIVTYEEQTRGWMAVMAGARTLPRQIEAYRRLMLHLLAYRSIQVVAFDESAAVQFQHLRALRLRVGTADLKIAAIALARDATLLSRNLVDFQRVPGLKVEDWSA